MRFSGSFKPESRDREIAPTEGDRDQEIAPTNRENSRISVIWQFLDMKFMQDNSIIMLYFIRKA